MKTKVSNVKNHKSTIISNSWTLFFICGLYSFLIIKAPTGFLGSLITIGFIFACGLFFFDELKKSKIDDLTPLKLLACNFFVYLGIAVGAYVAQAVDTVFWVSDSIETHIPMVDLMVNAITEGNLLAQIKSLAPGTTTHILTALCFIIFGKSTYSTLLALFTLKSLGCLGVYFLARALFNPKSAYISGLLYALTPTVLFYTLTLYKEAAVQAFVAWIFYFFVLFFKRHKTWAVIPFLILIGALSFERVYLPWLIIPAFFLMSLFSKNRERFIGLSLAGIGLLGASIYTSLLNKNPLELFTTIEDLRVAQMTYKDYSFSLNYGIPYPLAIMKAFFTPFLTPIKFQIFSDYSYLLIWGSFVNQILLFSFLFQWWKEFKHERLFHLFIVLPFIVFILLLAYIAPWAGRIRDSFYPIVVMYAGVLLTHQNWRLTFDWIRNKLGFNSSSGV